MKAYPHLASLVFNKPLMIHRPKLHAIIRALAPKIGADPYDWEVDDEDDGVDDPKKGSAYNLSEDGIATIPVYGTLVKRALGMDAMSGLASYESLSTQLMEAATNPQCKAILLSVDSYGGECAGVFDLSDMIYQLRQSLPVYGIANSIAYSAGYAVLSACEKIFVTQDGAVGSIGVIAEHEDQSEFNSKVGVKYTAITFGDHKNDFSPNAPLSDSAKTELQDSVDRFGNMFVALVARNRNMSKDAVLGTQAALFDAPKALTTGLVDGISTSGEAYAMVQSRVSNRRLISMPGSAFDIAGSAAVPTTAGADVQRDGTSFYIPGSAAASASAAAISNKEDTPVSTQANPADVIHNPPVDVEAIRQEAKNGALAEFASSKSQIIALCAIAGKKHLAADFITAGMSIEKVQEKLLEARTKDEDGGELQTEFLAQSTVSKEAVNNPSRLMDAVKRRLKVGNRLAAARS